MATGAANTGRSERHGEERTNNIIKTEGEEEEVDEDDKQQDEQQVRAHLEVEGDGRRADG